MAKIKYKTKGVERKGGGNVPKPGVYRCKVISCVDATPSGKDRRLEVTYEIQEGESKGYKLYDYINLVSEAAEWKLAQFVDALGLPENGTIDTEEIVDTALNVRTRVENSEQYGASAKPATLMPLDGDEDEEDLTAEDDDDTSADGDDDAASDDDEVYSEEELEALEKDELKEVAEEYEVEWPKRLTAAGKKKVIAAILEAQGGDEDDDDTSADDGDDDASDDEVYSEEELEALEKDELKEVAEEYEVEWPKRLTAAGKKKVIATILEAQGGDEDEDEEGDDDELWTEEELTELDDDDLIEQAGEFELDADDYQKTTGKGKAKKTKLDRDGLIAAILEAQGDEDEDGEESEEEDETPDYDEMELADLKALCKERSLNPKGTKKVLVARLKKDDEPF